MTDRTFTFSTGVVATLRPVSPFIRHQIERSVPMPEPPLVTVPGPDGEPCQEPNEADPAYQAAVQERERRIQIALRDVLLLYGVDVEIEPQRLQVARQMIEGAGGVWPEDEDEKLLYIKYCCIGTDSETDRLIQSIRRGSEATEEDVAAALRLFQRDVSGA